MTPWSSLIARRFRDGSNVRRGMAFMMISTLTGSVMIAAIRHLGTDIHPFEMVFFRSFFGHPGELVFFAPWLIRQGLAPLRTRHIVLHGATLRDKLVKIGAKVVRHGRYVTFQLAEVAVPRDLFRKILSLIDDLRRRPAPA